MNDRPTGSPSGITRKRPAKKLPPIVPPKVDSGSPSPGKAKEPPANRNMPQAPHNRAITPSSNR